MGPFRQGEKEGNTAIAWSTVEGPPLRAPPSSLSLACPVSFLSPCHLHAPRPPQPLLLRAAAMSDPNAVEAPVTFKAYMMCAFASFGGIFFGYDSGYINGVLASQVFIDAIEGPGAEEISAS